MKLVPFSSNVPSSMGVSALISLNQPLCRQSPVATSWMPFFFASIDRFLKSIFLLVAPEYLLWMWRSALICMMGEVSVLMAIIFGFTL